MSDGAFKTASSQFAQLSRRNIKFSELHKFQNPLNHFHISFGIHCVVFLFDLLQLNAYIHIMCFHSERIKTRLDKLKLDERTD